MCTGQSDGGKASVEVGSLLQCVKLTTESNYEINPHFPLPILSSMHSPNNFVGICRCLYVFIYLYILLNPVGTCPYEHATLSMSTL